MTTRAPVDPDLIPLFVDNWAALHAGALERDQHTRFDRNYRHWQCTAATLIAEGLLAYMTVEMIEQDLAHDREVDPHITSAKSILYAPPSFSQHGISSGQPLSVRINTLRRLNCGFRVPVGEHPHVLPSVARRRFARFSKATALALPASMRLLP